MSVRRGWVVNVLLGLLLIGYQILAHRITAADELTPVGVAVMIVPLIAGAAWALAAEFGWRATATGLLAGALICGAAYAVGGRPSAALVYGLPHFSANLFLLWFFARTLRAGREPLVTRIARRLQRDALPEEIVVYTRRVTIAWAFFFAAQLLASVVLYALASRTVWSLFINIVSSLLIPAMFVCEFAWRWLHYREHARGSMFAGADIFSNPQPSSAPADHP